MRFQLYGEDRKSSSHQKRRGGREIQIDRNWFDEQGLPTGLHDKLMRMAPIDKVNNYGVRLGTDDVYYHFEIYREPAQAFRAWFDLAGQKRMILKPGMIEIVWNGNGRLVERYLLVDEGDIDVGRWVRSAVVEEVDLLSGDQVPTFSNRSREYLASLVNDLLTSLDLNGEITRAGELMPFGRVSHLDYSSFTTPKFRSIVKLIRECGIAIKDNDEVLELDVDQRSGIAHLIGHLATVIRFDSPALKSTQPEYFVDVRAVTPQAVSNLNRVLGRSVLEELKVQGVYQQLSTTAQEYINRIIT